MSKLGMRTASDRHSAWVTFRYWAVLAAKIALLLLVVRGVDVWVEARIPSQPRLFNGTVPERALGFTILIMVCWLIVAGLMAAIVWDHRMRCRTCLRRLRMPIATGLWTNVLFSRPRTEYICPYGHGTLKVEELQITGHSEPDWEAHDEDIWKELISLDKSSKE